MTTTITKKHIIGLCACATVGAAFGYGVRAEGAPTMQPLFYAGTLEDKGVLAEGPYTIHVSLFDAAKGGDEFCTSETSNVPVEAGRFRMDVSDCSDELQKEPDAWVAVSFTGDDGTRRTIPGRTKVGAVPYAMEAQHAVAASGAAKLGTLAPADVQKRVSGTCPAGQSIREVASDGTVTCETDTDTTYSVTPNAGLKMTGTALSADAAYLQRAVTGSCPSCQSIRQVAGDGSVMCEVDDDAFAGVTPTRYSADTAGSPTVNTAVHTFCALTRVYTFNTAEGQNPACDLQRNGDSTWTLSAQSASGYIECQAFCI